MKKLEIDKRRLRILQSINKSIAKENDEHKKNIEIFENVLGIKALPMLQDEALTEIVAELGNTPLAEPKLYKMIEAGEPMAILEHIKGLEGNANLGTLKRWMLWRFHVLLQPFVSELLRLPMKTEIVKVPRTQKMLKL